MAEKASKFHFGGDAEENEDGSLTFSKDPGEEDENDKDGSDDDEEGGDDEAPEDDFNAAWNVLDLARTLYSQKDDQASQMKLAETYIALGDISLETGARTLSCSKHPSLNCSTEKFDQAITDFRTGLAVKESLLPFHNREIAEAHYKLGLVLDLTSGRLGDALTEIEKAVGSISARLELLNFVIAASTASEESVDDSKGKGKDSASRSIPAGDPIASLTIDQAAAEIKDLEGLKADLVNKVSLSRIALCSVSSRQTNTLPSLKTLLSPTSPPV